MCESKYECEGEGGSGWETKNKRIRERVIKRKETCAG